MSNGIARRQNEDKSIAKLAAQRQLYSNAKKISICKAAFSVWIPFVLAIVLSFVNKESKCQYIVHVLSILSLVVAFFVKNKIKECKNLAALIQQQFDIYVYNMPWDDRIFGENKELCYEIGCYSKKILNDSVERAKLINWYVPSVDEHSINQAIQECQRENYCWDVALRKKFKGFCLLWIAVFIIIVFGLGCYKGEDVVQLIARLAFILPMIEWLLNTIEQLNEDIENLKEIDSMLNRPSTNSMEDLQDIQKKIFDHRKGCYTIPNCVYNIFKDNDEDNAHRALRN